MNFVLGSGSITETGKGEKNRVDRPPVRPKEDGQHDRLPAEGSPRVSYPNRGSGQAARGWDRGDYRTQGAAEL